MIWPPQDSLSVPLPAPPGADSYDVPPWGALSQPLMKVEAKALCVSSWAWLARGVDSEVAGKDWSSGTAGKLLYLLRSPSLSSPLSMLALVLTILLGSQRQPQL